MSLKDIGTIQTVLWDARTKWYNIGIQLKREVPDLDVIKEKNRENPDECFTEMVAQWLRQGNPPPTWIAIVKALRSPTVNLCALAETIESDISNPERTNKSETHQAAAVGQRNEGEHKKQAVTATYQHIREFKGLSDKQKDHLEVRLTMESENIQLRFYTLRNKFFDSLDLLQLPIKKLVRHLKGLKVLKNVASPKSASVMQSYEYVLENISDIEDIKDIVEEQSTFFDFRLVEYMIENVGLESDKQRLEKYKEDFEHYIKRRIFECPEDIGPTHNRKCCELVVKLEKDYDKLIQLKQFQCQLSIVLDVSVHVLHLRTVREGCIQIHFLIPTFIQEAIIPLSVEQEAQLKQIGVIKLWCGDYHFPPENQVIIL